MIVVEIALLTRKPRENLSMSFSLPPVGFDVAGLLRDECAPVFRYFVVAPLLGEDRDARRLSDPSPSSWIVDELSFNSNCGSTINFK